MDISRINSSQNIFYERLIVLTEKAKYVILQNVCRESSGAGSLSWIIDTHFCALHFIDHCQAYSFLYSAIGPHNYVPMLLARPKDSDSIEGIGIGYLLFNFYQIKLIWNIIQGIISHIIVQHLRLMNAFFVLTKYISTCSTRWH